MMELKKLSPDVLSVLEYIFKNQLFPYQREWIEDRSRFKICNKARQIGISTCLGLEGVLDVLSGESCFFVSRTERQSIYLLDKFYTWMDVFEDCGVEWRYDSKTRTECRVNGVDVKSLTSEATAGEGFTGNISLDEFGLHENDVQIYRSLLPVITWGYKIRIVSRPFGQSNKFYEIWNDTGKYPDYRRYEFDINRALQDGLPVDMEEIRRNFDDDGFAENYLCKFRDESTSYFPYDLLRANIGESKDGETYLGVDIGRKHNATILCLGTQLSDHVYIKELFEEKNASYEDQRALIRKVITENNVKAGALDGSGLGSQLAEEINDEFPFMENHWFSQQSKEGMATKVKKLFETHKLTIPDDPVFIADIHSIRRTETKSNTPLFGASNTAQGHADRFWAMALMIRSLGEGIVPRIVFL